MLTLPKAGWTTFTLALLTALVVVWSVNSAQWVPRLPGLFGVAIGGGVLGLLAAHVKRLVLLPHLGALALGTIFTIIAVLQSVPGPAWESQSLTMEYRVLLWAQSILEGGASTDKLPFVLILTFGTWLLCYSTVFLAVRLRSVWALVPAGFALFTNLTYLPARFLPWLLLYLLAGALLLAWFVYLERSDRWREDGIEHSPWLGLHLIHASFWLALAIFAVTAFLPELRAGPSMIRHSWAQLRSPLGSAEGTFSRIFAALPARRPLAMYQFGAELPFRGSVSLTDDPVMLVHTEEPLYWRARTYEKYHRWGWENSPTLRRSASPRADIVEALGVDAFKRRVVFTVESRIPTNTIYMVGTPLSTSIPVTAHFLDADGLDGDRVIKLDSQRVIQPNQLYTVQSLVPATSTTLLEESPAVYPEWIKEEYLQIPEDLPQRILTLTEAVIGDATSPFAKAVRVRDFLRKYPYSQDIEAPPPGGDAVTHFLFREQAGYSDYFASSMVVMLRTVEVPARLAAGYLPGEHNPDEGTYLVRESVAHAWPEVYFQSFGWVPFEPTTSKSILVDAEATTPVSLLAMELAGTDFGIFDETDEEDAESYEALLLGPPKADSGILVAGQSLNLSRAVGLAATGLGLLLAGVVTAVAVLIWRWALVRPRTLTQAYVQMSRLGALAGLRRTKEETPWEYAVRLCQVVPEASSPMLAIAAGYSLSRYGPVKTISIENVMGIAQWGLVARALLGTMIGRLRRSRSRR